MRLYQAITSGWIHLRGRPLTSSHYDLLYQLGKEIERIPAGWVKQVRNEWKKHLRGVDSHSRRILFRSALGERPARVLLGLLQRFSPERILELGTGAGFSTFLILRWVHAQKNVFLHLDTVDHQRERIHIAQTILQEAKLLNSSRVSVFFHTLNFQEFLLRQIWKSLRDFLPWNVILLDWGHIPGVRQRVLRLLLSYMRPKSWLLIDDVRRSPSLWQITQKEIHRYMRRYPGILVDAGTFLLVGVRFPFSVNKFWVRI